MNKKTFCIMVCLLAVALISGCNLKYDIETIKMELYPFPRVVYIAGVDTEPDFSDVMLIRTARDGSQYESCVILALDYGRFVWVEHDIDFTKPGTYQVTLLVQHLEHLSITFYVQVIDK